MIQAPTCNIINSKTELMNLQRELRLRPDWHEPDEQDVEIVFAPGQSFDNAMGCSYVSTAFLPFEHCVYIIHKGNPVAVINMANLFAFACEK